MIEKILEDKGGLHNRVTKRIRLLPFTLPETKTFLLHNKIKLDNRQITDIYFSTGGIPYYLNDIESGFSAVQNINRMCFTKDGILVNEFDNLFKSLFTNSERHKKIVSTLSNSREGLTRIELAKSLKLSHGAAIDSPLKNLTEAGFITKYPPYNSKKKHAIYRLTDEYCQFYLRWVKDVPENKLNDPHSQYWQSMSSSQSWRSWSGYAFENLCYKHVLQIKKALGISGVLTVEGPWKCASRSRKGGAQIDLVIDRADKVVSICEMKYYSGEFTIDNKYVEELNDKLVCFREKTKTNKALLIVMITPYGVKKNIHFNSIVNNVVTLDDFFN